MGSFEKTYLLREDIPISGPFLQGEILAMQFDVNSSSYDKMSKTLKAEILAENENIANEKFAQMEKN